MKVEEWNLENDEEEKEDKEDGKSKTKKRTITMISRSKRKHIRYRRKKEEKKKKENLLLLIRSFPSHVLVKGKKNMTRTKIRINEHEDDEKVELQRKTDRKESVFTCIVHEGSEKSTEKIYIQEIKSNSS